LDGRMLQNLKRKDVKYKNVKIESFGSI